MKHKLFSSVDEENIVNAIRRAECNTSGEIRVHVASKVKGTAMEHAYKVFNQLKMHETKLHNGVLLYIAPKEKQVAVIGDSAIHLHVKDEFWDQLIEEIKIDFAKQEYTQGVIHAIEKMGKKLEHYFPNQGKNDVNELPNEISY